MEIEIHLPSTTGTTMTEIIAMPIEDVGIDGEFVGDAYEDDEVKDDGC